MKLWLALAGLGAVLSAGAGSAQIFTGPAGGDQPFDNMQSYVAVTQLITTNGIFPLQDPTPDESFTASHSLGMLRTLGGSPRPGNSAYADGSLHPISLQTAGLFSLLGANYGGDGTTNFALPDLGGRTIIGTGQGPGLSNYVIGQTAGSASGTIDGTQMPTHTHSIDVAPGQTGSAGGSQPVENVQPSLAMTYMIAAGGAFQRGYNFIGQVAAFAGDFVPTGWLPADGRLVLIDDFDALFNLIGTTFGGDGQTTFALPDLRGRTVIGAGGQYDVGDTLGTETNTLTVQQMPTHDHDAGAIDLLPSGGSQAFDNEQPSLALTYYVAIAGIFPLQGETGINSDQPYLGEIVISANNTALELSGYVPAIGQLLPINQNQALFALFGTAYGGNGITTFALPDLRDRITVGTGDGFGLGQSGGQNFLTLAEANLPAHVHLLPEGAAAVPEPGTWAMLILGFGMLGLACRRRRLPAAA